MNRRGFIGRMAAAIGLTMAGRTAVADQDDQLETKYWEAQSHLDKLYEHNSIFIGDTCRVYDLMSDTMVNVRIDNDELLKVARQENWRKI